nr:MAG TPA: hypothetical protein [Caudoviricetes sp.]
MSFPCQLICLIANSNCQPTVAPPTPSVQACRSPRPQGRGVALGADWLVSAVLDAMP